MTRADTAYSGLGLVAMRRSTAVYPRCSQRTTGEVRRSIGVLCSRMRHRAGVRVNATAMEATIARV